MFTFMNYRKLFKNKITEMNTAVNIDVGTVVKHNDKSTKRDMNRTGCISPGWT